VRAKALAELLLLTPNAQVMSWDADANGFYPVTGLVGDQFRQELQTDSDESTPFHCDEKLGDRCAKQCATCQEWEAKKRSKP